LGAGHSHALYVHEHSPIHRLTPEAKIVAAFGIVASIAITPRQAVWAFGLYAVLVAGLVTISRLSPGFVALRLLAITPFVLFALFIPFIAAGETTEIGGVSLSVDGLLGMWNVLAKATLGASVSIVLTATTEVPDIIRGLSVLRIPALFIAIATFMVRYLELIVDELGRMRIAMSSRGYDPRWISQARPIANAAGALFMRSYERGERVHSAMLSRGFNGAMPAIDRRRADVREWAAVLVVVACAALISAIAFLTS
jgi:cobalt/nickel transport system permease protein